MKVFFVNTNKAWGGGEKWHFETAKMLKNHGYDVALLCAARHELYNRCKAAGIFTLPLQTGNLSFLNPFLLIRLLFFFRKTLPDTVILNLSQDLKSAGIAARLAAIKHVIYRRGNAKPVKNSCLNRILFKKVVTAVIANSEETKRSILGYNPQLFPAGNIRVLYNGINLKEYDQNITGKTNYKTNNGIILGSAGRLSHEKGHHLLIETALLLKETNVPFRLIIAGDGPEKQNLLDKCRKTGLEDKIVFAGFVENIRSFMETIDIFILPSLWEGFGYVTIEAMALQKPVVAFNTGSNPEIIDDGKTGFLVSCYNTRELAEKILVLSKDERLRKEMGAEGRKRVERLFDSDKTSQDLIEYLESLN